MLGRMRLSALTGTIQSNDVPADVVTILQSPAAGRTETQQKRISEFYLSRQPELVKLKAERSKLSAELKTLRIPQTLAMEEMEEPRMSATLIRGNFLEKGEPVQPDVPAVLPPFVAGPRNRLGLAQWLVNSSNPLTARVTVNRWWGEFFGQGLVTTSEDFGVKGDWPTHPELLDWLACEFMERGWSMKHIHRLIVLSATYRQDSRGTPSLLTADDQNKLYGRGARFRLDAETIRDNALAIGGLLSLKTGGPPVYPFQPPGIWESKIGGNPVSYNVSEGEDRYRRGIYTVQKRTSPYPSFISFDAPTRNTCTVRRQRSNTPLQALTLLNDPVYVEVAHALARRILKEKPSATVAERIRHGFELCLARAPKEAELQTLIRLYEEQLRASKANLAEAEKLVRGFPKPAGVDAAELAAWFSIASALLNLDETITKS